MSADFSGGGGKWGSQDKRVVGLNGGGLQNGGGNRNFLKKTHLEGHFHNFGAYFLIFSISQKGVLFSPQLPPDHSAHKTSQSTPPGFAKQWFVPTHPLLGRRLRGASGRQCQGVLKRQQTKQTRPLDPPRRLRPMASISSMKMMQGAFLRASLNMSLTREGP